MRILFLVDRLYMFLVCSFKYFRKLFVILIFLALTEIAITAQYYRNVAWFKYLVYRTHTALLTMSSWLFKKNIIVFHK